MHDIDRTQLEYGSEMPGFEAERFDYEGEWGTESGAVLSEADEYELASELLGVASEEELDQFLGGLIKKVAKGAAGKLVRSPIGQAVGGVLKGVAKKALPLAGGALDGLGSLGAKIGSGLASAAGDALGVEGETLSQEDQEFEGAKQFVRLAADTVKKAAAAPTSADPRAVAQSAAISAARQLAPGLLKNGGAHQPAWRRRVATARAAAGRVAATPSCSTACEARAHHDTVCCLDVGAGGAGAADPARTREALRAARADGTGRQPSATRRRSPSSAIWPSGVATWSARFGRSSRGCVAPGAAPVRRRRSAASPSCACGSTRR